MSRSGKYFSDKTPKEYKTALLCVEGIDDAHFIDRLLDDAKALPDKVQILVSGGNSQIVPLLNNIHKSSQYLRNEILRIGVITDADRNPSSTLLELFKQIRDLSFPEPVNGAVVNYDNDKRRFGFFLVPALTETGALEELLFQTVHGEDHFGRVEAAFTEITALSGANDFRSKRLMGAYLAQTKGSSAGAGLAFKRDVFPFESPALDPIKNFITQFIDDL